MKEIEYEVNEKGCHVCTSHRLDKKGYPQISINGKKMYMSRYMFTVHNGDIPKGLIVRHTCDNPGCINPNHLMLGTYADNSRDMVERNRQACGSKVNTAKLTKQDVEAILSYPDNVSNTEIAQLYNVNILNISRIRRGLIWKSVPRPAGYKYTEGNAGEINGSAKLSEHDVIQILTESNTSIVELAKTYKVSSSTISDIKSGRKWKHVYNRFINSVPRGT